MEKATFGAGCFWGVEASFQRLPGVISTAVGYMGGMLKNPTYEDVSTGKTGHSEVVQIVYEPTKISFEELLNIFWVIHDPTQLNRQGPDIGSQYRSVIFYHDEEQKREAEKMIEKLERSGRFKNPVVTQVVPVSAFYPAEEYHQKFYKKLSERKK